MIVTFKPFVWVMYEVTKKLERQHEKLNKIFCYVSCRYSIIIKQETLIGSKDLSYLQMIAKNSWIFQMNNSQKVWKKKANFCLKEKYDSSFEDISDLLISLLGFPGLCITKIAMSTMCILQKVSFAFLWRFTWTLIKQKIYSHQVLHIRSTRE